MKKKLIYFFTIGALSSLTALSNISKAHAALLATRPRFFNFSIFSMRVSQIIPPAGPQFAIAKAGTFIIDPDPGTVFEGRITLEYNSSLFTVREFGWLGEWGLDPTQPVPEVIDDFFYPDNMSLILQQPNSELTQNVNIDSTEGIITVDFDWGENGFQSPSSEPFNFFAVTLDILVPATGFRTVEAGRGDVGLSLNPGDNFNICTPIDSDIVQECGEDQLFPDFILVRVPENTSTLSLLSLAVLGVASNLKSQLKRFRCKNF